MIVSQNSARLTDVTVNRRDSNGKMFTTLKVGELYIPAGARIGVAGPSGAGKSTLLDLLAGLLLPSTGSVIWDETALSTLSDAHRAAWRRRSVGQVFQDFLLIPELSILSNVLLPFRFHQFLTPMRDRQRALELIQLLGLKDAGRRAGVLSRGEQQRVALARALIMGPSILLADEPTASLDQDSAALVSDLLFDVSKRQNATLIIASHDSAILSRMGRVYHIDAGRLQVAS